MIVDVLALVQILLEAAEVLELAAELISTLEDVAELLTGLEEPAYAELSLEEKTDVLKRCTKIVANLGLNLSCYPLGYTTTLLFDLDGNPVP